MTTSVQRAERPVFQLPSGFLRGKTDAWVTPRFILVFWVLHIPLGLALYMAGSIGATHPLLVLAVGMYLAVKKSEPIYKVAIVVAYLVSAEVLWRMAQTPVLWEFGKYGSVLIMTTALLTRGIRQHAAPALIYFAVLIPSCFLTLAEYSLNDAKGHLSFNMSGPLSLAVFCVFFANTRLTRIQLKNLLIVAMAPVISVACVTFFFTASAESIRFSTESNLFTSGGFGPNQVSAALGLGAFFAISVLVMFKQQEKYQKILVAVLATFFAMQCIMTFSRGGIYNAIGASLLLLVFHFQNVSEGIKRTVPLAILGLIFMLLIFPALDRFTGGKLQERFSETGTTNRAEIVDSDFAIFFDNPVLGIGVALSSSSREEYIGFRSASHTEFTRLISEHGSFGILAILCILFAVLINFRRQDSILGRALVVGFAAWSFFFMINAGMRLAAPSFVFGLTFVTIVHPTSRGLLRPRFPRRKKPVVTAYNG